MAKLYKGNVTYSMRAQWWDYSNTAAYFITVNTLYKVQYFGEIQNGIMCLNEAGTYAYNEWLRTPEVRPDMNIKLGVHVVMPDHMHGIIFIGRNKFNTDLDLDDKQSASSPFFTKIPTNSFGPQKKNLSSIMRGYKSVVTRQSRITNPNFKWQTLFHDRIIRDQKALRNITEYIERNPKVWTEKRERIG